MSAAVVGRGPLWAKPGDIEEQRLPLWRALLIALGMEIILPFLLLGVNWSALQFWQEPPPVPVMSVRLEQPPQEEPPPPEPLKKQKPKPEHEIKQVPIVVPKPLPNEVQAKIVLPKLEPKPKPEPKPKEEEKPPEPVPEPKPEAQPLPSVFRDVKPVRKVKPKYPREAEDAHIQGRVRVRLTVEVNGSVSEAKILLSEPPGVFDAAVMEAVVQYIFKRDGTSYQADQEILFRLE
jgi:periplasmic protein TonB